MSRLLFSTVMAAALGMSLSTANAGGSEYKTYRDRLGFGGSNGTQLTGVALGSGSNGTIVAVILPSGETAKWRGQRASRQRWGVK